MRIHFQTLTIASMVRQQLLRMGHTVSLSFHRKGYTLHFTTR